MTFNNKTTARNPDKTTLVFLPGWGFKASIWETVTKNLAHLPIIMRDLPTTINQVSFNENSLDEITSEIDKTLPDNCILIAWSLGGLLALNLCAKHPKKYKKIILVASTPKFVETSDWPGISQANISRFYTQAQINLSELMQRFHQMILDENTIHLIHAIKKHAIASSQQYILRFYLDMLIQSDLRTHYKTLQIPVLHILGSRDRIIPASHIKHIKRAYSSQRVHTIKEASHIPFLSHTHEFINQILEFISQGETPA